MWKWIHRLIVRIRKKIDRQFRTDYYSKKLNHLFENPRYSAIKINYYLQKGAVLQTTDQIVVKALTMSSQDGREDIVKLLLQLGVDSNATDRYGHRALILASQFGRLSIVKLLLQFDADVNAKNIVGHTALMMAACNGYTRIVTALLQAGADVKATDQEGNMALMFAQHGKIAELLLQVGADINAKNLAGISVLTREDRHTKYSGIDYYIGAERFKNIFIGEIRKNTRILNQGWRNRHVAGTSIFLSLPKELLLNVAILISNHKNYFRYWSDYEFFDEPKKHQIADRFFNKPPTTQNEIKADEAFLVKLKNPSPQLA